MILAYTTKEIEAHFHRSQAKIWLRNEVINRREYDNILEAHPCKLYTPKFAFRILFFIAAFICLQGLIGILGVGGIFDNISFLPYWIISISIFIVNEVILIRKMSHFRSGLPQGVYYSALIYFLIGFHFMIDHVNFIFYYFSSLATLIIGIRYLDRFAIITSIVLYNFSLFLIFEGIEVPWKFLFPFVLFTSNTAVIFVLNYFFSSTPAFDSWRESISPLKYCSLILAGLSMNLFVVQQGAREFLNYDDEIPFRWVFILSTILVPVVYGFIGWRIRNRMFLRVGLALFILGLISLKYYYSIGYVEFSLIALGIIVFGLSVYLIRRFKNTKNGITSEQIEGKSSDLLTVLKAVGTGPGSLHERDGRGFGGGSFGGGGAGSDY